MSPCTIVRHSLVVAARTTAITPEGTIVPHSSLETMCRPFQPAERCIAGLPVASDQHAAALQVRRVRRGSPGPVAELAAGLLEADASHDRAEHRRAPGRHLSVLMEADLRAERLQSQSLPGRVASATPDEFDLVDLLSRRVLDDVEDMPGTQQRSRQHSARYLGWPVLGVQAE